MYISRKRLAAAQLKVGGGVREQIRSASHLHPAVACRIECDRRKDRDRHTDSDIGFYDPRIQATQDDVGPYLRRGENLSHDPPPFKALVERRDGILGDFSQTKLVDLEQRVADRRNDAARELSAA